MPLEPIPPPDPPPPRRVPGQPLPGVRYVPGLHPHPFRHPGGHLYTDGGPPAAEPWDADQPWEADARYLHALDLIEHRFAWEAHEALEGLWRSAPRGEPLAELLQGLIQLCAALLKRHMGHPDAARTLANAAGRRLGAVMEVRGPVWRGVDLAALHAACQDLPEGAGWPLVRPV